MSQRTCTDPVPAVRFENSPVPVLPLAQAVADGFDTYYREFKNITGRAGRRFEQREWHGIQHDALERLELYNRVVLQMVAQVRQLLGDDLKEKSIWAGMKAAYAGLITGRDEFELAETFFNSITRRIFVTVGVDPNIEFVDSEFEPQPPGSGSPVYRTYNGGGDTQALLRAVFADYPFGGLFDNLERDIALAAARIDEHLKKIQEPYPVRSFEFIRPVFYRNKGAYLIGRARVGPGFLPVLLALRHPEQGIVIDAVLLTEDEASIVFSYTRSYFQIEVTQPHHLVHFLKSIMPLKRVAELYISVGFNKHGKTELYRDLLRHLEQSADRFVVARGEKGMVMLVFTLPSYDMVFKVIRDRFSEPKTTTRQDVIDRYQLVFKHDRAGRLVDAQEFEYLKFDKSRFSDELLQELLDEAPSSVALEGDCVAIRHLYTERRMTPLNLYLNEAGNAAALDAAIDFGDAVKDLAATNIFPGDILLKNFGVTRHGRVVFYDYDELTLLTDCRFRSIPKARSHADEFQAEPWFYVSPNDIFPEELKTFLGLQGELRERFLEIHGDLFQVDFWRKIQKRIQAGEVVDVYPYKHGKRLCQVQD